MQNTMHQKKKKKKKMHYENPRNSESAISEPRSGEGSLYFKIQFYSAKLHLTVNIFVRWNWSLSGPCVVSGRPGLVKCLLSALYSAVAGIV